MKIIWLTNAAHEFDEAVDWIASKHLQASASFAQNVLWQINQLGYFPQLGRVGRCPDTRELVIRNSHYIAVYRFNAETQIIQIVALIHESQQWPDEF